MSISSSLLSSVSIFLNKCSLQCKNDAESSSSTIPRRRFLRAAVCSGDCFAERRWRTKGGVLRFDILALDVYFFVGELLRVLFFFDYEQHLYMMTYGVHCVHVRVQYLR